MNASPSQPASTSVRVFTIYFDAGTSVHPDSQPVIRMAADYLNSGAPGTLVITGHADTVGSSESNRRLGLARAQFVADRLVERGIDPSRLDVNSAGEACPYKAAMDGMFEAENRRVEMQFRESMPGTGRGDPAGCRRRRAG
jgi:outer membrane protein OmpA-like peptidoglycan-associated protein